MHKHSEVSRREFIRSAATAAAGTVAVPQLIPATVLGAPGRPGANERVTLGVIGVHFRGPQLIQVMPPQGRVVAISDCYTQRMDEALVKLGGPKLATYQDYRQMFDREKLDGVVLACRAMQRVLIAMHAIQRGLDVYAEKPLSLYVREAAPLIRAVKKQGTVFQHGTQCRSVPLNRWVCDFVRRGGIGKLKKVLMRNHVGPIDYPGLPEQPIPEGLDWDAWTNQAPLLPYNDKLYNSFSKYRCYDGGQVTNWVHGQDMLQLALGADEAGPVEIWPADGYQGPPELRPVEMRYADGTLVSFELESKRGPDGGAVFVGEDCKVELNFNKVTTNPPDFLKNAPPPMPMPDEKGVGLWTAVPHLENWLDCIKTRKTPNAPVEVAHRSTTVSHLMNLCRQVARKLRWDPAQEQFTGDDEANALLNRLRRTGYELPELT